MRCTTHRITPTHRPFWQPFQCLIRALSAARFCNCCKASCLRLSIHHRAVYFARAAPRRWRNVLKLYRRCARLPRNRKARVFWALDGSREPRKRMMGCTISVSETGLFLQHGVVHQCLGMGPILAPPSHTQVSVRFFVLFRCAEVTIRLLLLKSLIYKSITDFLTSPHGSYFASGFDSC